MEELYEAKCREGEVRKLFLSGLSWRLGVVFIAIVSYHGSCSVFPFSITFLVLVLRFPCKSKKLEALQRNLLQNTITLHHMSVSGSVRAFIIIVESQP